MANKDIAIIGMSCFAPGATDINKFWNNLVNSVDSITDAPPDRIDPRYFEEDLGSVDRFYCKRGGFVSDITFDPLPYSIPPVALEGMDAVHMLAFKLVYKALEDASVFEKKIALNKCALIIGKGNYVGTAIWRAIDIVHVGEQMVEIIKSALPDLSLEEITKIKKEYQVSKGRYQADSMPGLIPNLIASLISNKLDMQGPAYTVDAACASSLIALEHAVQELHSGRCNIAVAGGVHASQNATFWSIFNQLGALSRKQKITPFNEDADGLLIGEGGGFVVLKTVEKALSDNDRIYAVIKGIGISSDGSGVSVMAPSEKGQTQAIRIAWENADMDTRGIGYIEAHGTATVVGDKTELKSLSSVFPNLEGVNDVLIGSVKSNIGHAMPAAGVFGLIKTALALYNRQIPPTLHCDRPVKDIEKTRFRPVQKLQDWDETKYPLVAGVNAFGFGGINAHVILEAYGEKKKENLRSPFPDKVLVLSASTKEALIDALQNRKSIVKSDKDDNFRLILFNPTKERIEKAVKLVEKGIVWKGRQDIWFTNEPLLKNGEKVVFMYPGYDSSAIPETESLEKYLGMFLPEEVIVGNEMLNHALQLYRSSELMNEILIKLNLKSDANIGHSLGEWFGIRASGMVTGETVKALFKSLDPKQFTIEKIYFVAVGCGQKQLEPIMSEISDIYVSNDNCKNQALLCGTEDAVEKLKTELQKRQIFYQVLPFQSGFHSPFIKDKLYMMENAFEVLKYEKSQVPMWSANTLDVYPQDALEIKKLSARHLLETVRFRELIEKLYDKERARVFVQVGSGSLVGFVDDILSEKKYGTVSLTSPHRSTLEQLRRVMALLYIEGKNVDLSFMNAEVTGQKENRPEKGIKLDTGMHITKSFPLLSQLSEKQRTVSSAININSFSVDASHPVLNAIDLNMKEMALMQADLLKLYESGKSSGSADLSGYIRPNIGTELIVEKEKNTGKAFEEELYVSLKTHPFIIGHSLVKQPSYWTNIRDLSPVIPMTMTVELMGETAQKQDPSKKICKIGPISVFQWMEVNEPFIQKITGVWKSEERISLGIKGFASAEVTLGESYDKPDDIYKGSVDLGESVRRCPSKAEVYEKYMFHGPEYQGIEKVTDVTEKGIRTYIRKAEGKGSLLDNVGQTYGLFIHLMLDKNFITFPVKIQEITFYQDMQDQDGLFECVCLSREIGEVFTTSDIVVKREGKIWCIIKGWQNRRLEFDNKFWDVTLNPRRNLLAEMIAPDVHYYYSAYEKQTSWNFLYRRYLNQEEKQLHDSLLLNKRKNYLIGRIALKDGLRSYVLNKYGKETYPIEYAVRYDTNHKPYVYGMKEVENLEISIAHKGTDAVSIVSGKPVGIDIETIEERTADFMELSYTERELELLKGRDPAEWSTRFWVAKEAYGKMLGLGLQGNPKRYEVKEILDEENLVIENCEVKTIQYKNFIIGWTK